MLEYVIGIDIGGTNIKMGAVDYRGEILANRKFPTESSLGAESILERVIAHIESIRESITDRMLRAIGFGVPGAVDFRNGVITQAPNIPVWSGLNIRETMIERFKLPCFIENDANAVALGEYWMGAGRGQNHICCLTLGTGVGGGVIIRGELLRGADGMAAELGHIAVQADGAPCKCGSHGCLETFASGTGIVRMLLEALGRNETTSLTNVPSDRITPQTVYDHAVQGDPVAGKILDQAGWGLGVGLATLVNTFNPEVLIIGGGVSAAWDLLIPPAISTMKKRAFEVPASHVKVVRAQKEDDAGIYGSAYVAWDALQKGNVPASCERALAPWGYWEVIEAKDDYKVKRLVIHPGHRLSYQKHQQREETWMIAAGKALIKLDGKEQTLYAGETIRVPRNSLHRIGNPGDSTLVFFEVQRGPYLGEDDITRLEDDYRRS